MKSYKVRTGFLVALIAACILVPGLMRYDAQQIGIIQSTNPITIAAATTTQLIAPVTGKSVEISNMGFSVDVNGNSGNTVQFVSCTDGTCSTGSTPITGALVLFGQVATALASQVLQINGNPALVTTPGSGVFAKTTGTQAVRGWITFLQR